MRIQDDTELTALQGWTVRRRPAAGRPARPLLLLHGWTGDENAMWVFVRNFPPDYVILAPRAPHPAAGGGYSWRAAPGGSHGWPRLEDFRAAAGDLLGLLDAYAAQDRLEAEAWDVIGFSQGAALTNVLALLHPERVGRVGVLAGFLPEGSEGLIEARPLQGKKFFVAHGTLDEMVPIEIARRSVRMLEQAGASVAYCEDSVGHKLGAGGLRAMETFFA